MKKNILIAGASKGIGLAIAQRLADQYNLYTLSRHQAPRELEGISHQHFVLNPQTDSLDALDTLPEEIHGLAYSPGSITLKPINRLTKEDFLEDFQQNVIGAFLLIQKVQKRFKKAGASSVVLFSTVAVQTGIPFHSSIAAAKGAIEGMGRSLAAELVVKKVRVNVIAPSLVNTDLAHHLISTEDKLASAHQRHPLGRIGEKEDIAALATFLLSDESSWITGQVIQADGGLGALR